MITHMFAARPLLILGAAVLVTVVFIAVLLSVLSRWDGNQAEDKRERRWRPGALRTWWAWHRYLRALSAETRSITLPIRGDAQGRDVRVRACDSRPAARADLTGSLSPRPHQEGARPVSAPPAGHTLDSYPDITGALASLRAIRDQLAGQVYDTAEFERIVGVA